jgi:hypothetical protein
MANCSSTSSRVRQALNWTDQDLVTKVSRPLNLFYEEPETDRWIPFDRYPRRIVRRLWRGPRQPSGHKRVLLNLVAGLDRIGRPYRLNDYRFMKANQDELSCVIGKPHVLEDFPDQAPLLFGPSIYNHPIDDENLPKRHAVRQVLVPSEWVQRMFSEVWPGLVTVWPVGIETERWTAAPARHKDIDVLIYDKIFRDREQFERTIFEPLLEELKRRGLVVVQLRYGSYVDRQLLALSRRVRSMVYFSRHETQGIALQQILSSDVPVFAYDPGGEWQVPDYLRRGVRFGPVSSVPYWDKACGVKFGDPQDVIPSFDAFWNGVETKAFAPRQMIFDRKLTLEDCAQAYADLADRYSA